MNTIISNLPTASEFFNQYYIWSVLCFSALVYPEAKREGWKKTISPVVFVFSLMTLVNLLIA